MNDTLKKYLLKTLLFCTLFSVQLKGEFYKQSTFFREMARLQKEFIQKQDNLFKKMYESFSDRRDFFEKRGLAIYDDSSTKISMGSPIIKIQEIANKLQIKIKGVSSKRENIKIEKRFCKAPYRQDGFYSRYEEESPRIAIAITYKHSDNTETAVLITSETIKAWSSLEKSGKKESEKRKEIVSSYAFSGQSSYFTTLPTKIEIDSIKVTLEGKTLNLEFSTYNNLTKTNKSEIIPINLKPKTEQNFTQRPLQQAAMPKTATPVVKTARKKSYTNSKRFPDRSGFSTTSSRKKNKAY